MGAATAEKSLRLRKIKWWCLCICNDTISCKAARPQGSLTSKLVMNIPLDLEQFPPQVRDMVTRVIYHERFGGVLIKKPLSIRIAEGI